jgi:hypothetical protein
MFVPALAGLLAWKVSIIHSNLQILLYVCLFVIVGTVRSNDQFIVSPNANLCSAFGELMTDAGGVLLFMCRLARKH